MSKHPLSDEELKKVISITQAIEGYRPANKEVVQKSQSLREQYGIKVSLRK